MARREEIMSALKARIIKQAQGVPETTDYLSFDQLGGLLDHYQLELLYLETWQSLNSPVFDQKNIARRIAKIHKSIKRIQESIARLVARRLAAETESENLFADYGVFSTVSPIMPGEQYRAKSGFLSKIESIETPNSGPQKDSQSAAIYSCELPYGDGSVAEDERSSIGDGLGALPEGA